MKRVGDRTRAVDVIAAIAFWVIAACLVSQCAGCAALKPTVAIVKKCTPVDSGFQLLVSDALDLPTKEAALAQLDDLALQTASCVVREALVALFPASRVKAALGTRAVWAQAWLATR